jgi:osmotically inducible lipoprotein OsmB
MRQSVVLIASMIMLASCGHGTEQRAATGAVVGAVLGGPVGAAAGAATGTVIAKTVDDKPK